MIGSLLSRHDRIYIVGAQSRAKTLTGYFSLLYPNVYVEAYLVDEPEQKDNFINGVPIRRYTDSALLNKKFPVFIATKGIYHCKIQKTLLDLGFETIVPITFELDNFLRNEYVRIRYEQKQETFIKLTDLRLRGSAGNLRAVIYMAKSIYDNPLETEYICPYYEKVIQAGAALTEQRLSKNILTDSEGDNISKRNRQFCELTVLYWIWKNSSEEIVGLSHYRRHFIFPDKWQDVMISNNIDVILPLPTLVQPDIEENYKQRHDSADWEYLMDYLKKNNPDDYRAAKQVFSDSLYSPCNMFVMRKAILDNMCEWLFPILDAVVANGGEKEDVYLNRYPGFISERLITLYFYKNRDKYHIAYADKNFIS